MLKGISQDSDYYNEPGQYEPSRYDKIKYIGEQIKSKGYPFDEKYILVDQDGYILDGVKRASFLYYLYGPNYKIPVYQISVDWEESINERRKKAEEEINYYCKTNIQNLKITNNLSEEPKLQLNLDSIKNLFNDNNIEYYIIDRIKKTNPGNKIVSRIIIKTEQYSEAIDLLNKIANDDAISNPYRFYANAYAIKGPYTVSVKEGKILFYGSYCIQSKFVSQIVPADKKVQKWIWENSIKEAGNSTLYQPNIKVKVFITILECLVEDESFSSTEKEVILQNINLLDCKYFKELLETEFYNYTESLIENIKNSEFEKAIKQYISFSEY